MPFRPLSRGTFMQTSGVSIAHPWPEAMSPCPALAGNAAASPKRMVLVGRSHGLYSPYLFPETSGRDYVAGRYLKLLEPHHGEFTVFSGMSHHYGSGHGTRPGLMTGVAPDRMRQGDLRNSISLHQEAEAR